jgi:hypothetical protein
MGSQPFRGLDVASQPGVARILQEMRWRQDLRKFVLDRKVTELRYPLSAGISHKVADLVGSVQSPWKLSEGFRMAPDRCRRLRLRIEDSIKPVRDDLFSKLPVTVELDRINHYAEASETTSREQVNEGFVIVSTHIKPQRLGHRTHCARAR